MEPVFKRFDAHVEFCYLWKSGDTTLIYAVPYVKHNAKITATVHSCSSLRSISLMTTFFNKMACLECEKLKMFLGSVGARYQHHK